MTKSSLFAVVVKFHGDLPRGVRNLVIIDNSKVNRGFAAGVNLGVKKALEKRAGAVMLINPDLKISQSQIDNLFQTPGDIVAPVLKFKRQNKWICDFGGKVNWLLGRTTHWEDTTGPIDYVSGACMLVKKKVFERIGFFSEKFFLYLEDVDFCLRAKAAGFKIVVNPKIVVEHQISEQRFSRNRFKLDQNVKSNRIFIDTWVPWYFRPAAYVYWFFLWLKTRW